MTSSLLERFAVSSRKFNNYLRSKLRSATTFATAGCPKVVYRYESSSWITNVDVIEVLKRPDDPSRFYGTVPSRESLEIESPVTFDRIVLPVMNAGAGEGLSLTAEFETGAGDESIETAQFENTGDFDMPVCLPVSLESETPVERATISWEVHGETSDDSTLASWLRTKIGDEYRSESAVRFGVPSLSLSDGTPIVLISIDSLPYSHRAELDPIIEAMGAEAVIPGEPRTQGTWTSPSHASMFTGVHPLDHQHIRSAGQVEGSVSPIREDLTVLPELLAEHGYDCSGIVSTTNLLPQFGFGRGFSRYRYNRLYTKNWLKRKGDAKSNVDTVLEWIRQDSAAGLSNVFYFVELFDPHYPYIPPLPVTDLDLQAPIKYSDSYHALGDDSHPVGVLTAGEPIDQDIIDQKLADEFDSSQLETIKEYHRESIRYTAEQVRRLVAQLKRESLFEEALILVTGDHGEEFGEQGTHTHGSVYDSVIRPFMIIKPPSSADWQVPDAVDTIDFLPTIAREIGAEIPDQCQGDALQGPRDKPFRITEQIWSSDWYQIAVEKGDDKGIFSFDVGGQHRPTARALQRSPDYEEFYALSEVRKGNYETSSEMVGDDTKAELRAKMEAFLSGSSAETTSASEPDRYQPDEDAIESLRQLGYR